MKNDHDFMVEQSDTLDTESLADKKTNQPKTNFENYQTVEKVFHPLVVKSSTVNKTLIETNKTPNPNQKV